MIIIRYAEIALKGLNRGWFESKLVENIKDCLKKNNISFEKIERIRGRIYVYTESECNMLSKVFGISSFSYAKVVLDINELKKKINIKEFNNKKFAVRVKKSCDFPNTTKELEKELGSFILDKTPSKVDLTNPEITLYVEIFNGKIYFFYEIIQGPGGLPIGTEAPVAVLMQDDNSIVVAYLLSKRGSTVIPLFFKTIDERIIKKIENFTYGIKIRPILLNSEKELENYTEKNKIIAVATSTRLENFKEPKTKALKLAPLIGYTNEELRKIKHAIE